LGAPDSAWTKRITCSVLRNFCFGHACALEIERGDMKIIHDDPPMPEEIENGFYPRFENGWRHAEVVGRCLMVVFIAGCVGGLLGPGLRAACAEPRRLARG